MKTDYLGIGILGATLLATFWLVSITGWLVVSLGG